MKLFPMDIRKKDPVIVELSCDGLYPVHHVVRQSELKKVGLIAVGTGLALTAMYTAGHYALHRMLVKHTVKKQLAPLNEELDALRAENAALRQQLSASSAESSEQAQQEA